MAKKKLEYQRPSLQELDVDRGEFAVFIRTKIARSGHKEQKFDHPLARLRQDLSSLSNQEALSICYDVADWFRYSAATVALDDLESAFTYLSNWWHAFRLFIRLRGDEQLAAMRSNRCRENLLFTVQDAICFALAVNDEPFLSWQADMLQEAFELGYRDDGYRQLFPVRMLFQELSRNLDPRIQKLPLGPFAGVFEHWNSSRFSAAIEEICDFRFQSDCPGHAYYDTGNYNTFELLFPLELYMIYAIRRRHGLECPPVNHPLVQSPLFHPYLHFNSRIPEVDRLEKTLNLFPERAPIVRNSREIVASNDMSKSGSMLPASSNS